MITHSFLKQARKQKQTNEWTNERKKKCRQIKKERMNETKERMANRKAIERIMMPGENIRTRTTKKKKKKKKRKKDSL